MNHDVPQPTTATRSPRRGSSPATSGASRAARRQQSGWDASSASIRRPVPARSCSVLTTVLLVLAPGPRDGAPVTQRWPGCAVMLDIYQKQSLSGNRAAVGPLRRARRHREMDVSRYSRWNDLLELLAEEGQLQVER